LDIRKENRFLIFRQMKLDPAILLLGSNLGDRKSNLIKSTLLIEKQIGKVLHRSALYETKPWGKSDQPDFINQVLIVETTLSPHILLKSALAIEKEMGRIRTEIWGARLIDIDLLYVGTQILHSETLKLPHAGIAERRFVLEPLAELLPDFIHPALNKSHRQLLQECADRLSVHKI
jgi:2-amino-4-hydroxy-6-hydroxymethyldihydropteridine diphosphokinase